MKLIPDESVRRLQSILIVALWGLGTIILGTLFILAIAFLITVSNQTIFGTWGVASVLTVAGAAMLIAWRGYTNQTGNQTSAPIQKGEDPVYIPPPVRERPDTLIPFRIPALAKSTDTIGADENLNPLSQTANSRVMDLKRRFDVMLTSSRLGEAEEILTQLQIMPEQNQWRENARRRLLAKRQRSS